MTPNLNICVALAIAVVISVGGCKKESTPGKSAPGKTTNPTTQAPEIKLETPPAPIPLSVTKVTLSAGADSDGLPKRETDSFRPEDPIVVAVEIKGNGKGELKAKWSATQSSNAAPPMETTEVVEA